MKIPQRPTEPVKYTFKEHEGRADAPVFTIRPLTDGEVHHFNNLVENRKADALQYAADCGLVGWENLDSDFTKKAGLMSLPPEWRYMIGMKTCEISSLTEAEKN